MSRFSSYEFAVNFSCQESFQSSVPNEGFMVGFIAILHSSAMGIFIFRAEKMGHNNNNDYNYIMN